MIRLLLCLILLAVPALAEMPAGHDDPRFEAAVEAWLDADNQALHDFHRLAGEGNVAALIMRRRVSTQTIVDYPDPVDPFWLDFAENSPLGLAFGIHWHHPPEISNADRINTFLQLGEARHAARLLQDQLSSDGWKNPKDTVPIEVIRRVETSGLDLPGRLMLFALTRFVMDPEENRETLVSLCVDAREPGAEFEALLHLCEALGEGDIERADEIYSALVVGRATADPFGNGADVVEAWLMSDRSQPYFKLCNQVCGAQLGDCVRSSYARSFKLVGFVGNASPVETLVPQLRYQSSRRRSRELWAKLSSVRRFFLKKGWPAEDGDMPACLKRALDQGLRPWEAIE